MFTTDVPFEDFQWDEMKRAKNLVKHGLDFEDAMLALSGPRIELPSVRGGEARVLAICPSEGKLAAIVYTMRGTSCRIISMRSARPNERKLYHAHDP